jgi:hypothetical protein
MMHQPDCGKLAARTHYVVSYHGPGGIDHAEFDACCGWAEPPEYQALIDEAEIVEIVTMDGYELRAFTDYGYHWIANPRPGHCISPDEPWSWARIAGLPVHSEFSDPDQRGLLEVRPRPEDNG